MPEYLSPGVYIEEIPGPQPIQGVSTSTTGMVGVTRRGPTTGRPVFVESFATFQQVFGGYLAPPADLAQLARWELDDVEGGQWWRFAHAVKGFFDNGGRRLYVQRVVSSTATSADATIPLSSVTSPDDNDFVLTAVQGNNPAPWLRVVTQAQGEWGKEVWVRIRPQVSRTIQVVDPAGDGPITSTLGADVEPNAANATFAYPARLDDVAANTPIRVVIGDRTYDFDAKPANANGNATIALNPAPTTRLRRGTRVKILRRAGDAPANGTVSVPLARAASVYPGALVLVGPGRIPATVTTVTGQNVTFAGGNNLPALFETEIVGVVEAEVTVQYRPSAPPGEPAGEAPQMVEEIFAALRLSPPTGADRSIVDVINDESSLIDLEVIPAIPPAVTWAAFPADAGGFAQLDNGRDNLGDLLPTDFEGTETATGRRTGIQALEDVEDVSLVAVPGMWSVTVQSALIAHCERLRNRFAVLDPQSGLTVQGVQAFRSKLESQYAALYHPWLRVLDPLTGKNIDVPPSGHMTGLYARVDNLRGVHKAPANETVAVITGLTDDINTREQDVLNPVGINALRTFPNRGIRVWGARTLSGTPEWRYVNVRRLFIYIEESIRVGTQWVVFEPNNESLWALVRQAVTNFLDSVWRSGALEGTKQEEAFYVHCDRSTMSEDDIANGRLIVEIGIAPTKPAEFVIFRFRQKTREQVAA